MLSFTGMGHVSSVVLNEAGSTSYASFCFTIPARFSGEPIVMTGDAWGKVAEAIAKIPDDAVVLATGSLILTGEGKQKTLGIVFQSFDDIDVPAPSAVHSASLYGNLGGDPDTKYLQSGKNVTKFTVAINAGKDKAPHWFTCEAWDKTAEVADKWLSKGSSVALVGWLKIETWTDKDSGEVRTKPVVVVDRLTLGRKSDSEGQAKTSSKTSSQASRSNVRVYDEVAF